MQCLVLQDWCPYCLDFRDFFFLVVELIPGWLHGLNACLCWNMLFALLVSHLVVQFSPKGILFIHSRTASWYAVSRYNKEVCFTHALLAALKIWGSCVFKSIVSSKWLTLSFASWHCSVRRGMITTANCVAFMVLSSVTGDGRKFSVWCFYMVCFMQVHWLMACNAYIATVQNLGICTLCK